MKHRCEDLDALHSTKLEVSLLTTHSVKEEFVNMFRLFIEENYKTSADKGRAKNNIRLDRLMKRLTGHFFPLVHQRRKGRVGDNVKKANTSAFLHVHAHVQELKRNERKRSTKDVYDPTQDGTPQKNGKTSKSKAKGNGNGKGNGKAHTRKTLSPVVGSDSDSEFDCVAELEGRKMTPISPPCL